MARKAVTIRDVAQAAQVSPATVSNVFGGRKPVAAPLAERVRVAAGALGYQADRAASLLRSGRSRVIAILVPDLDNPFYTAVISCVEDHARRDGYEVFVASSRENIANETSRLSTLLAWRLAGVVMISTSDRFPGRKLLDQAGTPYVLADRPTNRMTADTITTDGTEAGAIGAAHLAELGHRNLLVAASTLKIGNMRERCAGAVERFRAQGGTAEVVELGLGFDQALATLRRWLDRHPCPSAVLALTNFTTLGVLAALGERGMLVPEEVSVIGFDDYAWMRARVTPLTAIRQPVDDMGRLIWERLSARIGGDHSDPVRVNLPCELMVRASTSRGKPAAPSAARPPVQARAGLTGRINGHVPSG